MPLILDKPESAAQLTGLKWVCCECLAVNRPACIDCINCGKTRWQQLGVTPEAAEQLAKHISSEGYGHEA
jgi:hypothetical protein